MANYFTLAQLNRVLAEIERGVAKLAAADMLKKGASEQTEWVLRQVLDRIERLPAEVEPKRDAQGLTAADWGKEEKASG